VLVVETDLKSVQSVAEGVCPECGESLDLLRLNAITAYLEENPGTGAAVIGVWDEEHAVEVGEKAEYAYRCPKCGEAYTVYLLTGGDWELVVDK